jgi:hypothetical protein
VSARSSCPPMEQGAEEPVLNEEDNPNRPGRMGTALTRPRLPAPDGRPGSTLTVQVIDQALPNSCVRRHGPPQEGSRFSTNRRTVQCA